MDNCRMETETADMPPSQRRRRTWQCSGGEGSAAALSSVIKLHGGWTVEGVISVCGVAPLPFISWPEIIHLIYSLCACRHVMNELLETERAYVEELLCVLQVGTNS